MSKKLLLSMDIESSEIHYNITYSSWWMDEGRLYKETYDINYSIIVSVETNKRYYISAENADREYYAFLDSDSNLIDSIYSGFLNDSTFASITPISPTNTSSIILYLNSTNISNVTNFTINEVILGDNLYDLSDSSMQTSWWILDDSSTTIQKDTYDLNYSIIVPIERDKKYFIEYTNGDRTLYTFMDSSYNQVGTAEYDYYKDGECMLTSTSPSDAKYLIAYLNSTDLSNVTNISVREFNTK